MAKKKQPPTHGGRRKGAGRPAIYDDRIKLSVVMDRKLGDRITAYARTNDISISIAVQQALAAWLEREG